MFLGLYPNVGEMCSSDSVLFLAAQEQESLSVAVPQRAWRVLEQIWVPFTRSTSPCRPKTDAFCGGPGLSWHSHDLCGLLTLSIWLILPHSLILKCGIQPLLPGSFSLLQVCGDVLLQGKGA